MKKVEEQKLEVSQEYLGDLNAELRQTSNEAHIITKRSAETQDNC
jgi:hypothetical protein